MLGNWPQVDLARKMVKLALTHDLTAEALEEWAVTNQEYEDNADEGDRFAGPQTLKKYVLSCCQ